MENQGEAQKTYEKKKQEKMRARENQSQKDGNGKASKTILKIIILVIVLLVLFIGFKVIIKGYSPQGQDFSQGFREGEAQHITVGSLLPEYSSNPPSSGPHYSNTIRGGFYNTPVEDQFVIHNLEHGDIWIAYKPDISVKALNLIKDFAGTFVIVSPRENNVDDIAVVSWGRTDTFNEDELTKQRVRDFILRYDNKGLESVRGGSRSFK